MFSQIFLSPKVKQSTIISNKHGIYEFSHKLPNDLRLRILGNKLVSRPPPKITILLVQAKTYQKV